MYYFHKILGLHQQICQEFPCSSCGVTRGQKAVFPKNSQDCHLGITRGQKQNFDRSPKIFYLGSPEVKKQAILDHHLGVIKSEKAKLTKNSQDRRGITKPLGFLVLEGESMPALGTSILFCFYSQIFSCEFCR